MSAIPAFPVRGQHGRRDSGRTPGHRTRLLRLALGILWISLPLGCSSGNPERPGPPEPGFEPALFYSPGTFCLKGRGGEDTLVVLNQGDADLVWSPIRVPDWTNGLDDEIRLAPGEGAVIPWEWFSPPQAPFSDTVLVGTNVPGHDHVRIILENVLSGPPAHAPPVPLLAFPADSAVFSVGDTIFVAWQTFDTCSPIEYRLQISLDAAFTQVVCCPEFRTSPAAEVIVEQGDRGRAWWRVVPRWVGGITGAPSAARTWLVE